MKFLAIFLKALEERYDKKKAFIPIINKQSNIKFPAYKTVNVSIYCVTSSGKECISQVSKTDKASTDEELNALMESISKLSINNIITWILQNEIV